MVRTSVVDTHCVTKPLLTKPLRHEPSRLKEQIAWHSASSNWLTSSRSSISHRRRLMRWCAPASSRRSRWGGVASGGSSPASWRATSSGCTPRPRPSSRHTRSDSWRRSPNRPSPVTDDDDRRDGWSRSRRSSSSVTGEGLFGDLRQLSERVCRDEGLGLGVHPLDGALHLVGLAPPLATPPHLDRRELAGAHQRISLRR